MLLSLIAFEIKRRTKMLSSWVYALVLFLASLLMILDIGGVI